MPQLLCHPRHHRLPLIRWAHRHRQQLILLQHVSATLLHSGASSSVTLRNRKSSSRNRCWQWRWSPLIKSLITQSRVGVGAKQVIIIHAVGKTLVRRDRVFLCNAVVHLRTPTPQFVPPRAPSHVGRRSAPLLVARSCCELRYCWQRSAPMAPSQKWPSENRDCVSTISTDPTELVGDVGSP